MGTLEGLLHREYVEGMDEDYATSGLTATDCFFNRFKTVRLRRPDLIAAKRPAATGIFGLSQLTNLAKSTLPSA